MTHLDRLCQLEYLERPRVSPRVSILDVGSGDGGFLIDAAQKGIQATGLEINRRYIERAREKAAALGLKLDIVEGEAEEMPFASGIFHFANINEVIEHVESPFYMLMEVHRVLRPGGSAYLSVPNRFAFRDQHFHLYFVNWLPRFLADPFARLFTKRDILEQKTDPAFAGRQWLADMHYYTYRKIGRILKLNKFTFRDIREQRIAEFPFARRMLARLVYPLARFFYFDTFHLLITKENV